MAELGGASGVSIEDLWRAHAPAMFRYASLLVGPSDAADVVSCAFTRVSRSRTDPGNPRAYLMRAVTNAAFDQRRSDRRRQVRDLHAVLADSSAPLVVDVDVVRAVAALAVRQRAVVYFTYWEDLDATQIAHTLRISPASVRRHLARARTHLRKVLQ